MEKYPPVRIQQPPPKLDIYSDDPERSISLSFAVGPRAQGSQMISPQSLREWQSWNHSGALLWSTGLKCRDLGLSSASAQCASLGRFPLEPGAAGLGLPTLDPASILFCPVPVLSGF